MSKPIPMIVSLHVRAPGPGEKVLLSFAGASVADVEAVEVTITDCGLYISTEDGPILGIGLKALCQAAMTAGMAHRRAGAA